MGLHHNSKIVTDGLVLCLDAANPKSYPGSGNTWKDLSGNGNHATRSDAGTYSTWNSAGYFEHRPQNGYGGTDTNTTATNGAHWTINHSSELAPGNNGWTVNGWLKVIGTQSHNGVGWFHKGGSGDERGIHIEPIRNAFRANASNGWSRISYDISALYHNNWANYCFVFTQTSGTYGTNSGNLKFYINGQLAVEDTDFIPRIDGGEVIRLMRRNGHHQHYLNGDVANYYYYTKALSQNEVKANYNALKGRFNL
jgi:hypothetical protein